LVEVGERLAGGVRRVRFLGDVARLLERHGVLALPPYIRSSLSDPERYQTVYAERAGSVAAPTAGLHLTREVLARCRERGVEVRTLELAVGLATFRPITTSAVADHAMHEEGYTVPVETWEACGRARRVVAVGTTTVRALESVAATGRCSGRTKLFIKPGYDFAVVDVLMTNFHQPRSSLLVMLEAFAGPRWRDLYREALAEGYRFLSFGDSMLVARR
jgi:S-adenosylmethionine:tRNA ribosyltransferase-isomerase